MYVRACVFHVQYVFVVLKSMKVIRGGSFTIFMWCYAHVTGRGSDHLLAFYGGNSFVVIPCGTLTYPQALSASEMGSNNVICVVNLIMLFLCTEIPTRLNTEVCVLL